MESFDFISLCETWVIETGWEKLKDKLSKSHMWDCSFAKKKRIRKGGLRVIL